VIRPAFLLRTISLRRGRGPLARQCTGLFVSFTRCGNATGAARQAGEFETASSGRGLLIGEIVLELALGGVSWRFNKSILH